MSEVSVIIPTLNSEKTISECLQSIKKQNFDDVKVIVVDSFSSDSTKTICKSHNVEFFEIKSERAYAKNFALSRTESNFVLFIDSDMILESNVIGECVSALKNSDNMVAATSIPEVSTGKGIWVKIRNFERIRYSGTEVESPRFFKTNLAKTIGGFDEDLIFFEESSLPRKLLRDGYQINRINSRILHDETSFDLAKWLKKKYYYGQTLDTFAQRYPSSLLSFKYRIGIILKYKFKLRETGIFFLMIFLKFFEFLFAKLGEKSYKRISKS